jgi:hypothetical protein
MASLEQNLAQVMVQIRQIERLLRGVPPKKNAGRWKSS